ncbi:MAG TPA: YlxR family protein [Longimicrobiales bacterium]|nr:YlxR family protein [Longimicrobiales bacterium]
MPARRAPVRTCVGCRGREEKGGLLRVVRGPGGGVTVDPRGRAPGRGAYLHRRSGCLEAALARGALARALRTGLDPEEVARLRNEMEREARP